MAQWRKVAKAFALGDGHISENEVNVLRKAFFADEDISKSELDFLHELKTDAKTSVKALDTLIEDCEKAKK
ncbi:MAG TPA: hypothetical protein ENG03_11300 [Thioploca sp.]|nr:MAG: hypothetical protein DRR19_00815 [Gammaproteobacteria bacterium]HDN27658.1 hypothetical protein [Thioploca sp.]